MGNPKNYRLCVLLALRYYVWLFDNCCIQLPHIHQCFLFAFWTEQRKICECRVMPYSRPGLAFAGRA